MPSRNEGTFVTPPTARVALALMLLLLASGGSPFLAAAQQAPAAFMRGAAMGMLPTLDCNGTCSQYRANASAPTQDALQILADYGLNTVRLRLFGPDAAPNNSYAALDSVLAMARRAHAAGLEISLDIFYSQWFVRLLVRLPLSCCCWCVPLCPLYFQVTHATFVVGAPSKSVVVDFIVVVFVVATTTTTTGTTATTPTTCSGASRRAGTTCRSPSSSRRPPSIPSTPSTPWPRRARRRRLSRSATRLTAGSFIPGK